MRNSVCEQQTTNMNNELSYRIINVRQITKMRQAIFSKERFAISLRFLAAGKKMPEMGKVLFISANRHFRYSKSCVAL